MQNRITILGVPLDPLTFEEAVKILTSFAMSKDQHHVMTPNPEMIVTAQKNPEFMTLLHQTSLNLADGTGLLFIARFLGREIPERVTGTDIVQALASKENIGSFFFLGSADGIAQKASTSLKEKNPHLRIAGCESGSPAPEEMKGIIDRINQSGATILFVAFGAPTQDLWIKHALPQLPKIRLAMGIGGAFDFIAGVRVRAPRWMQNVGIEWLWRLIQEPRRLPRIWRAVVVFPFLVLSRRNRASM